MFKQHKQHLRDLDAQIENVRNDEFLDSDDKEMLIGTFEVHKELAQHTLFLRTRIMFIMAFFLLSFVFLFSSLFFDEKYYDVLNGISHISNTIGMLLGIGIVKVIKGKRIRYPLYLFYAVMICYNLYHVNEFLF